jgi:hypothetical protein
MGESRFLWRILIMPLTEVVRKSELLLSGGGCGLWREEKLGELLSNATLV